MTDEEKEKTKTTYYELAPSLQKLLDSQIGNDKFALLLPKVYDFKSRMNGITVTIGLSRPAQAQESKNINFDSGLNLLEAYHDTAWNRRAAVFK